MLDYIESSSQLMLSTRYSFQYSRVYVTVATEYRGNTVLYLRLYPFLQQAEKGCLQRMNAMVFSLVCLGESFSLTKN